MEYEETYTVTIVRNLGSPISFSVRRWKALSLIVVFLLLLVFFLYSSIAYLLLSYKVGFLSEELGKSEQRVKTLSKQIKKIDHDRYWKSYDKKLEETSAAKSLILEQPDFSNEGIWVTNKSSLSDSDYKEAASSVKVDQFSAKARGNVLKLSVKIKNMSKPPAVVGGFMSVTLVNKERRPTLYKSATQNQLGENGFPSSYKQGKRYYIKRKTSDKNIKFKLTKTDEYYTDVIIFLFSYKGRLLNKHEFKLEPELFLE